jgi:hypothetical protein
MAGVLPLWGARLDASPSEAGEQREVQPAVEGQGSLTPAPPPPHEVACLLMQSAMLGGRDLTSRALDQRPQVFAGEPTDLDANALDLRVELRPLGEVSGRVKVPKQPARRIVVDVGPKLGRPSGRPSFAGSGHSDNRMTLAIYTRATEGMQDSATPVLEETSSRSGC